MATGRTLENVVKQGRLRRTYPVPGEPVQYRVEANEGRLAVQLNDQLVELELHQDSSNMGWCKGQGKLLSFAYDWVGEELHIWLDGALFVFQSLEDHKYRSNATSSRRVLSDTGQGDQFPEDEHKIITRTSGRVLIICLSPGDTVSPGEEVCVIEAMKMEHSIRSSVAGVVGELLVRADQQVSAGDVLISLKQESGDTD